MTTFNSIRRQALKLTSDDRQVLIHDLIASLDTPTLTETENIWFDLAKKRLEEIKKGKKTIAGDQFFENIRQGRGW